jgi:hypothetical protein
LGKEPVNWQGSWTLEDYVMSLFEKGETQSPEFKVLLQIYGREKIEELWKKYQKEKKSK